MLSKLNLELRSRIETVYEIADRAGEHGIVEWLERAAHDARQLGHLRARDEATLVRLEDTFGNDFYREYRSVDERELMLA